ncbi:selenoprotein H-like [Sorex fumeus]|uniref:selenoprotein H-like n=1 Tax=Sorex fumeus TaxID=62283 RepID=UPI0024ACC1F7|nr:selenoprotein H-like [Sorex fumeus]
MSQDVRKKLKAPRLRGHYGTGSNGLAEKREKVGSELPEVDEMVVVIEHCTSCRVYRHNAMALSQALRQEAPELPVKVNRTKPRRGSFEVTLLRPDGSRVELWTGIKKGSLCKLKFLEPQELVVELKKHLP